MNLSKFTIMLRAVSEKVRVTAAAKPHWVLYVGFSIPLIGFLLDYFIFECVLAFARSGSVLVAYTLCLVFVNHLFGEGIGRTRSKLSELEMGVAARKQAVKEQSMRMLRKNHGNKLVNSNLDKLELHVEKQVEANSHKFVERFEEPKMELDVLFEKREVLGAVELTCGVLGTLVWGFGDLLCV